MSKYITKYSSKEARQSKTKRDAKNRRSGHHNGATAVVSDMDDIANYTTHQQAIAAQVEEYGDCLFA